MVHEASFKPEADPHSTNFRRTDRCSRCDALKSKATSGYGYPASDGSRSPDVVSHGRTGETASEQTKQYQIIFISSFSSPIIMLTNGRLYVSMQTMRHVLQVLRHAFYPDYHPFVPSLKAGGPDGETTKRPSSMNPRRMSLSAMRSRFSS